MMPAPSFVFLVHPLVRAQRVVLGLRQRSLSRARGLRPEAFGRIGTVGLPAHALGEVVGLMMEPEQMLASPMLAVERMEAAARSVAGVRAVGLGSLCAVVGGRGEELARRLPVPVTTGALATSWALHGNARGVLRQLGRPRGPVAVIGSGGPVGELVARLLLRDGVQVRVDNRRGARAREATVCASPDEAAAGCPLVIGAGTTGGVLDPAALARGAVLVDVASPGTLKGPPPDGVRVVPGEAIPNPPGWHRGVWGRAFHRVAGYGPRHVYACLVEPLVLAASGRDRPYALGARLLDEDLADFDHHARALGFRGQDVSLVL